MSAYESLRVDGAFYFCTDTDRLIFSRDCNTKNQICQKKMKTLKEFINYQDYYFKIGM